MIVEFFIQLGTAIGTWFASLFPVFTPPEFLTSMPDKVNAIFASLSGVGVWADWPYLIGIVGVVIVVYSSGFVVKFARWVWSLIPFVGGGG